MLLSAIHSELICYTLGYSTVNGNGDKLCSIILVSIVADILINTYSCSVPNQLIDSTYKPLSDRSNCSQPEIPSTGVFLLILVLLSMDGSVIRANKRPRKRGRLQSLTYSTSIDVIVKQPAATDKK